MNDSLLKILSLIIQIDETVQMKTLFEDILDFDSMVHVTLMVEIEREFHVKIPTNMFGTFTCLNDVLIFLEDKS